MYYLIETRQKGPESHVQCMKLKIFIHIKLNLIPMLVTLALIRIEIFLFVMSNEISVTLKKIASDTTLHFRKLICSFQLKSQFNCFKLTIHVTLF